MTDKKIRSMTKPELIATLKECGEKIHTVKQIHDEILKIREDLDADGLLDQLKAAHADGVTKYEEIEEFYEAMFVDDAENKSMKIGLEETIAQIEEIKKEMLGSPEKGVSGYIDKIKESIAKHDEKCGELLRKIETDLSAGATAFILAKNFRDKVEECKKSRKMWERWTVGVFSLAGVTLFILSLDMSIPSNSEEIIFYIFRSFSLLGVLVWLGVFMGNRRAENRKLEESYKHKEVMASSFSGYKESIKELDDAEKSLLTKHMDNLLDAIKKDSSNFLSAKGEGHPLTGGDNRKTGETQSEPR